MVFLMIPFMLKIGIIRGTKWKKGLKDRRIMLLPKARVRGNSFKYVTEMMILELRREKLGL